MGGWFWAFVVGCLVGSIFLGLPDNNHLKKQRELEQSKHELEKERVRLEKANAEYSKQIIEFERQRHLAAESKELCAKYRNFLEAEMNYNKQTYPWLAEHVADVLLMYDMDIPFYLRHKPRPAMKAADEVAAIAKAKRDLQKENKKLQYQLAYYETLFPWLEEFKEVPPETGWAYVQDTTGEASDEYEMLRPWLSPQEFNNLSTTEKYQLVLDRYKNRRKTDWEIGIDYERYVGYLAESQGHRVKYTGAIYGVEDMGRDLIIEKPEKTVVVQCKRWAKEKTIHEKHIFQLFGTVTLLALKNPTKDCIGCFVTTTKLSDTAKLCADRLGIVVVENFAMGDFPMIKCNVSEHGKIYHLPVDQQYDRTQITGKDGAMFAWTVKEAEDNGFRRAWRWHPDKPQ